jgi:transcription initiation factor TFIIB
VLKNCNISDICRRKHSHIHILTDPTNGEAICIDCGAVITEKIAETGPEWGAFAYAELNLRGRAGMPMSLAIHDQGLSTVIGRNKKDFSGKIIVDSTMRSLIERVRIWDYRTQTKDSKGWSRKYAFRQLDNIKEKLSLPYPVVEKAAYIYRKAQRNDIVRGRTITGAMAACVYIACREAEIPRTFDEVARTTNITRKGVSNAYIAIVLGLDLKIPLIDLTMYLVKLANKTHVDEKIKRYALGYLKQIIDSNISAGKDPMSIAATVLYLACLQYGDESKTQRYFAEAAGISDVTIRNRRQELQNKIPSMTSKNSKSRRETDQDHEL